MEFAHNKPYSTKDKLNNLMKDMLALLEMIEHRTHITESEKGMIESIKYHYSYILEDLEHYNDMCK